MKITFIRHGEVEQRYQGCYNGHIDISLSQNGHNQAKKLAKKLKNEKYDAVFCSDLKRAKQTMSYFVHAKDAIYTDKLREKSWGKHEGLTFDEIISQGEIKYENFLQWIKALDGQDYKTYTNRIKEFFQALKKTNKQNILIVTHAGVIKTFISLEKNIPLKKAFELNIPYGSYLVFK